MIAQKIGQPKKRVKRNQSQAGIVVRVLKEMWEVMKDSKDMYDAYGMSRRLTNFQQACNSVRVV